MTAIETSGRELTPELADLMEWEKPIEAGLRSFVEVGNALAAIRDGKKYKAAGFATFDDYCRQRWGLSKTHANRSIQAASVITEMTPLGVILPESERQVRPLAAVPDPVERAAIWEQAVENAGGEQPTAAEVAAVAKERSSRSTTPETPTTDGAPVDLDEPTPEQGTEEDTEVHGEPPRQPQRLGHPATFSKAILNVIASYLTPGQFVVDPFAGVGTIHELEERCQVETFGIELEQEWAAMHHRTVCADARDIVQRFTLRKGRPDEFLRRVDVIATSPAYGNRMADHHDARDGSHRNTYKHMLGRDLSDGSSASMQWGPAYRELHAKVWAGCAHVLADRGLFLLNIKDHVRDGEVQHVASWHVDQLCRVNGLRLIAHHIIPGAGLPSGENEDLRVVGEEIYVFQKGES